MEMLTASIFRWMGICHRRVWRDIHVDRVLRDTPTLHESAVLKAGVHHEETIHQVTAPQNQRVVVRSWSDGVQLTKREMTKRVPVILNAFLEVEITSPASSLPIKLGGRTDRLELQTDGLYVPIEIKRYSTPHERDELQLSFYVWMLCQLQKVATLPAVFWLSKNADETPKHVVPYFYDPHAFEAQLHLALEVTNKPEPEVNLLPECHTCHWYSVCYPEAVGKKHITLLTGLRQTTQQDLAKAGIQT